MAFKFIVASSSVCPPERKVIPGTAAGTVLRRAVTVARALSSNVVLSAHSFPFKTMFGFNRDPSRRTFWSASALYTAARVFSVINWQVARLWSPSIRISGSTIGASPFAWQIAAYRARVQAVSLIEVSLIVLFWIFKTAL